MGQKINPIGLRLGVNRTADSRWYADDKDYGNLLLEDLKIRDFIHKEAKQAGVSRVIIERPHKKCRVTIHAARPGVIIGKKGADIETLRKPYGKIGVFTENDRVRGKEKKQQFDRQRQNKETQKDKISVFQQGCFHVYDLMVYFRNRS